MGAGLGIIVALALVACVVLLWLSLRPRDRASAGRASYRSVGLRAADPVRCCEAVQALADQRFLPGQAPSLPLPECTASHCTCRYEHFDDRRAISRRGQLGQSTRKLQSSDWGERRRSRGRRKTDRRGLLDEVQMRAAVAEKRRRRAGKSPR